MVADSSAGFVLPGGAVRQPDASWTSHEHLARVDRRSLERFALFAPDFAAELRSPSDSLPELREKVRQYIRAGIRLAWLIDPSTRTIEVYRDGREPEVLRDPVSVSGEPVLAGFTLDAPRVFEPSGLAG